MPYSLEFLLQFHFTSTLLPNKNYLLLFYYTVYVEPPSWTFAWPIQWPALALLLDFTTTLLRCYLYFCTTTLLVRYLHFTTTSLLFYYTTSILDIVLAHSMACSELACWNSSMYPGKKKLKMKNNPCKKYYRPLCIYVCMYIYI